MGIQEDVFIHPTSVIINTPPPDFLVFHEVIRSSQIFLRGNDFAISKLVHLLKGILLGLTIVNSSWLPALAKDTLCSFSKPVRNNLGVLMTIPKFGPEGWELPAIKAK